MTTPTVTETAITREGCRKDDNPMTVETAHTPESGEVCMYFPPTVPADDGCIDSPYDSDGFLTHA